MRLILSLSLSGLTLICLAGCPGSAPSFVLNAKTKELLPSARAEVTKNLEENFGTPLNLIAWEKFPVDYGKADPAVPEHKDAGWKMLAGRNLYMQHCIHCHGVTGDGNGPTARFLNPRPRDYRLGIFKFTSTGTGIKPSRDDLQTILKDGIPGTSMPSFKLLPQDQLTALVEYVRWLSVRGGYEYKLATTLAGMDATEEGVAKLLRDDKQKGKSRDAIVQELDKSVKDNISQYLEEIPSDISDDWAKADDPQSVVVPSLQRVSPTAASIAEGRKLFLSEKTKCADCHGKTGEGNGVATEQYWPITGTNKKYDEAGLHDDWGNLQLPRNLTRGQYRGGRRPLDLFRRIYAGIKGTQMPAFGKGSLTDEQIWHVVNYVMSIPFDGKESAHPVDADAKPSVASNDHKN